MVGSGVSRSPEPLAKGGVPFRGELLLRGQGPNRPPRSGVSALRRARPLEGHLARTGCRRRARTETERPGRLDVGVPVHGVGVGEASDSAAAAVAQTRSSAPSSGRVGQEVKILRNSSGPICRPQSPTTPCAKSSGPERPASKVRTYLQSSQRRQRSPSPSMPTSSARVATPCSSITTAPRSNWTRSGGPTVMNPTFPIASVPVVVVPRPWRRCRRLITIRSAVARPQAECWAREGWVLSLVDPAEIRSTT